MSELSERAEALRREGLSFRLIAQELGISTVSVYRLLNPAYAERGRQISRDAKRRRTGVCVGCGATTSYNGHTVNGASTMCHSCANQPRISREAVVTLRLEGGLTQKQIAQQLGCSQARVSKVLIECGMGVGRGSGPGRGARLTTGRADS